MTLGVHDQRLNFFYPHNIEHVNLSLKKTLNLVKFGNSDGFTNCLSEITLGSFIENEGLLISLSYSDTIFTLFKKTSLTASCQLQSDNG